MSLFLLPGGPWGRREGLLLPRRAGFFGVLLVCGLAWSASAATRDTTNVDATNGDADRVAATADAADAGTTTAVAYLETVNVTATRGERTLRETPGQVSVVSAEEIADQGYRDVADLVRFLPGIYVDGDLTRLGTSGFNIRGIGGNRVATQVDGVPTSEQFDFGPFRVTQYALDLDLLESVEIVRSAGSSLYGSDALGGVVAFRTRHPRSYLAAGKSHIGLRAGYDGRADETSEALSAAFGSGPLAVSLALGRHDGHETENFGTRASEDSSRTVPNPIDRQSSNGLLKLGYSPAVERDWLLALESYDSEGETEVYSSRALAANPSVRDYDAVDTQKRHRVSLEGSFVPMALLADSWLVRLYGQNTQTEQVTYEQRVGSAFTVLREGSLRFEQDTRGLDLEARQGVDGDSRQLFTYGGSVRLDEFDQLRDRRDVRADTGVAIPSSIYPTKYFPASEVRELGLFVQDEIRLRGGKWTLLPGLRYDRYELDADQNDRVYFAGNPGTPAPVDFEMGAFSPRLAVVYQALPELSLFVQYAHGFRAPPMSWVNNGFTNQAGGYRTLPNPDLGPEESDNVELGVRGSHRRGGWSVVLFDNHYEDFIELVTLPFDPRTGLIEFQPRNLDQVHIRGIEIDGRARLGAGFELRAAAAFLEGENETLEEPLVSIAPPQLVLGLAFRPAGKRWHGELITTLAAEKKASDLPAGSSQFRAPASETFDAVLTIDLPARLSLQLSAFNLSDEKVWRWQNVQGVAASHPALDRYTGSGRNLAAHLRWRF